MIDDFPGDFSLVTIRSSLIARRRVGPPDLDILLVGSVSPICRCLTIVPLSLAISVILSMSPHLCLITVVRIRFICFFL